MGKAGWGLTLDTSEPVELLSPRWNIPTYSGVTTASSPPTMVAEDKNSHRKVVSEVDFFSACKSNDDQIFVKKENSSDHQITELDVNTGLHLLTTNSDQSSVDDGVSSTGEDQRAKNKLTILQVELEKMNTENQRLRGMLSQVSNNYTALQMHIANEIQKQQHSRKQTILQDQKVDHQGSVSRQPGPTSRDSSSEERTQSGSTLNALELTKNGDTIGAKRIARENTPDSDGWVSNKLPKLNPSKNTEQANESTMRKARVSVRARSEAPMMAKGNPCPRAYYRCTMAVGCPVRKQVQRCVDDQTILITTYEGTHSHPLPPAALAMASTTSAAASMLLSGSMSSADGLMNPNLLARSILPNPSSIATISASAPFPTVTLDLTHNPNQFQRNPNSTQFQSHISSQNLPPNSGDPNLYNQSRFSGLQLSHQTTQLQINRGQHHASFADSLGAATAAITADPNFTAALAAAISSIMSGSTTTSTTATTTANNNHKASNLQGN
ncbi:hypothetical protein Ccrd_001141 [Cynara cardunculus var. scolymus]|uniref:WRKY domain-containing protein n=1 Tax=Cynara cardunculus var. scolymus TaxID=59895 RepID=A0A103XTV6_CYNCS|nr:hypothetical protein Ccrd_001141 [Cynara cardunculus var. scolymus]